jgi:hypothetical protein
MAGRPSGASCVFNVPTKWRMPQAKPPEFVYLVKDRNDMAIHESIKLAKQY